jgi:LysB family phage lysis regulatory protein
MTRLLITGAVILALLGANLWQYQQVQDQAARAATAEQSAADRLATIDQLRADVSEREHARLRLVSTQQAMAAELDAQQLKIRELKRENDQYRQWADNPLPDITRRLQQRPALTGAGDYHQWLLSRGEALHAEGIKPNTEQ